MLPVLYSFRRCPYAMRARMALKFHNIKIEHREVLLKDKPQALLNISPKATVPVLQLPCGKVLEESRDIMLWSVDNSTLGNTVDYKCTAPMAELIDKNDGTFKYYLDRYKYADRYPEHSQQDYRDKACEFLDDLEKRLQNHRFLFAEHSSFADIALVPFVRQFSMVDKKWFDASAYDALKSWLGEFLCAQLFMSVMEKHSQWYEKAD